MYGPGRKMIAATADRIARLVLARPAVTLLCALPMTIVALYLASSLEFDTGFTALLSDETPEVVEVEELQEKIGGLVELVIAVGGGDEKQKLTFARGVVKRLRAESWILQAEVEFPVDFFIERRLLLASSEALWELDQTVAHEIRRAKVRANPLYVDLEDDEERRPLRTLEEPASFGGELLKRTFSSPDGAYLFIRVKPTGTSYDMAAGKVLLGRIKARVEERRPRAHGLHVRYAGSLVLNQEQHARMSQDLKRASIIALASILLLITLFTRRLGAPLILGVPLIIGVAMTLGLTSVTIGQLNLVSGFLVTALFGLGIDFEIHLYLRYLEHLSSGEPRRAAMRTAMRNTLSACLTSAITTACAFFAMAISDFRGYREYGIIAGLGVLVILLVTYLLLPPLAHLLSRAGASRRPRAAAPPPRRGLCWAMVLIGAGALVLSLIWAPRVRWHNDFRRLRGTSEKVEFSLYVGQILGGDLSPAAIFVENLDQAREVQAYLSDLVQDPDGSVKEYLSLARMVPDDVHHKLTILRHLERQLESTLGVKLTPEDHRLVDHALKLVRVRPWSVNDIPLVFRRQLMARDGKGQFVIIWPRHSTDIDHEIIAWGKTLERIRADLRARGIPARILDENRISAKVLTKMRSDAPYVVGAAGLAVLLILIMDLRRPRHVALVAGTLGVGVAWMLGVMCLWEIEINVFNQAVLATIIGVGIDNVVHIYHRHQQKGPGSVGAVFSTTGVAAFLASATTAIGFGAAVTAHHTGLQSFGWLSIVGLGCTFVASTIFFAAVLRLLDRQDLQKNR